MHNVFTRDRSPSTQIAQQLSIKAQQLISICLDYGLVQEAKELQRIDKQLINLLYKGASFDFVGEIAMGKTLLVGEGNLSFTCSLIKKKRINPNYLIATTFEKERELSDETFENRGKLKEIGVLVLYGVNATIVFFNFNNYFGMRN